MRKRKASASSKTGFASSEGEGESKSSGEVLKSRNLNRRKVVPSLTDLKKNCKIIRSG